MVEATLRCQAVQAAAVAARTITIVAINSDILSASTVTEIQIPSGENWYIDDVYISVSTDVATEFDGYVVFDKNKRVDLTQTALLSTTLLSNASRSGLADYLLYRAGETLRMKFINIALTTAARTTTFYVKVQREIFG